MRNLSTLLPYWPAILLLGTIACQTSDPKTATLAPGVWRATLEMQEQTLPFTFEISTGDSTAYQAYLRNGEERILLDEVSVTGDSVKIPMLFFDTEITAKIEGEKLKGTWTKNYVEDYALPFAATHGEDYRFIRTASEKPADVTGKWAVNFEDDSLLSVGVFEQDGDHLTGSFLTTTGDYRFLEGNVEGRQMMLSAFDGEHAFLFKATLQNDSTLQGDYWSGKSYHTTWTARRDANAQLPDANELTYLKEGYDEIDFTFPNLKGEMVSLSDEKYQGKVVIVQIFGTWCPNCMDETKFYTDWYRKHRDEPVEIIGLAYERKDDFAYASSRVQKMIDKLGVPYDFLIAGTSDKEAAARTLPMLNHVMSFPTSIFIDKNGKVRNIHTGFSGPGTGVYYEQFAEEFNVLMEKLLAEEVES